MTRLWCNGQWVDFLDFGVLPTDRGLSHGLGLFETILSFEGQPIFARRHVERLRESSKRLGWTVEIPELRETMIALLSMSGLSHGRARIRLALTGGSGRVQDLALGADHLLWMTASPAAEPPLSTTANLSPWRRNEHSALVGLKAASYAENIVALDHATHLGFEEAIFLNTAGNLCETATANLFLVKSGAIFTPTLDSGCLGGITRQIVIELADRLGLSCEETTLAPEELKNSDEIFLTSSIRGVMGLSKFEDREFSPGPITQALREAWNDTIRGKDFLFADVWR